MSYSLKMPARNAGGHSEGHFRYLGMDDNEAKALENEVIQREFGGGMSRAELQDFDTLISRLEGSKMRQAAQSNRARQRDTFAAGLAGMMGNF